jgi:hypothetical protein
MYVEIETEAAQFPEKEYVNGIFLAVHSYYLNNLSYPNFINAVGLLHLLGFLQMLKRVSS